MKQMALVTSRKIHMSPVSNRSGTSGFEPAARFYGSCSSHSAIVPYVCQTATSGKRKKGESVISHFITNRSFNFHAK